MTVPIGELRAELSADFSGFEQALDSLTVGLGEAARTVGQVAGPVTELEKRVLQLSQAWRTGTISETAYAAGLRQLKVDVAETAAATSRSAAEMERLARVGSQASAGLRSVTMHAKRGADGFEAFGVATNAAAMVATSGLRGVSMAASQLTVFALGNPWLIGLLAGVSAISSAVMLLKGAFDDVSEAAEKAQAGMSGMSSGRQRGLLEANLRQQGVLRGAFARPDNITAEAMTLINQNLSFAERALANSPIEMIRFALAKLRESESALRGVVDATNRVREATGGGSGSGANRGLGIPDVSFLDGVIPVPTALPGFKEFENSFDGATARMREMKQSMGKELLGMKDQFASVDLFAGLTTALQGIGEVLGESLAGVGDGLRRVGAVITSTLGGLLKAIGKSLIEMAIAKKLMMTFGSLNPFVAIAAGLAIIAAGAALSASSGGSGAGFSSGGGLSSPAAGSVQSQGDLTIIFPSGSVIDPSDPRQQDAIMRMIEAGQGRNVQIRTGAA